MLSILDNGHPNYFEGTKSKFQYYLYDHKKQITDDVYEKFIKYHYGLRSSAKVGISF